MKGDCGVNLVCGNSCLYSGITYNTAIVGTQCWMTKNLNVGTRIAGALNQTNNSTIEKYCYADTESNCTTYGGLYQWDEAMGYAVVEGSQGICPSGWHIPTDTEQYTLENYLKTGANSCVASRAGGWDCDAAGTALKTGGSSGLNFPLAGFRATDGTFSNLTSYVNFWSSFAQDGSTAWHRTLGSGFSTVYRFLNSKANGITVRCLKN